MATIEVTTNKAAVFHVDGVVVAPGKIAVVDGDSAAVKKLLAAEKITQIKSATDETTTVKIAKKS